MVILCMRFFLVLVRVRSLALKWFCPVLRDKIFPVRVTLNRLVYDLLVLSMILDY